MQSGPIKVPERKVQIFENHVSNQPEALNNGRGTRLPIDEESSSSSDASSVDEKGESDKLREEENTPPRKRRKVRQDEDIESSYLQKLARQDAKDETIRKASIGKQLHKSTTNDVQEDAITSNEEDEDAGEETDQASISRDSGDDLPQHESLARPDTSSEFDKLKRTVFLGNISTRAIKSKSAKNALLEHLRTAVKDLPDHKLVHKVESLRFRSTAFVSGAGPKKAAFAKGELMDQTTRSTNAYVVYATELAAQTAASKLNGTVTLDRHLRADSLAAPTKIDHRRCVFVGNLSFVDEEIAEQMNEDGTPRRPKAKVPADAEEGLWRAFSKAGKVESVRVVRDKETRIGKGFAYVQFFDENAVEGALLMHDKKFPPMLPRKLRVMRAKRTKQKAIGGNSAHNSSERDQRQQSSGRSEKRYGKSSKPATRSIPGPRMKEGAVFEGHRASKSSRESSIVSKHRKRHAVKPSTRSSKRGAAFKAAGGKRRKTSS